jgi:hypothetical protein
MELSFHHSFSSFNLKLAGGSDEAFLFVIFRGLGSGLSLSLSLSLDNMPYWNGDGGVN